MRLPDSVPVGRLEIEFTPANTEDEIDGVSDEERARRRANRALLEGELAGKLVIPDDAFAPMTEEELEEWYRPIDP
ncbi:MAG: hypothetical protein IT385_28650 [Deltaproteobacteria bacterium]|nr:hypothetical protein [Deltaproteobacteria bacterium]